MTPEEAKVILQREEFGSDPPSLVESLRARAVHWRSSVIPKKNDNAAFWDRAADEIERLQALVAKGEA